MENQPEHRVSPPEPITNHESEVALTPEIIAVLDQKREQLITGKTLGFRFVNSKEYFDTVRSGSTQWNIEVNEASLYEIVRGSQLKFDRERRKLGGHGFTWYEIAEEFTRWREAARPLARTGSLKRYRAIYHSIRESGGTVEEARDKFIEAVKHEVGEYIQSLYDDYSYSKDKEIKQVTEHLSAPSPLLTDDHREKLLQLLQLPTRDITDPDLRFLLRFYKADHFVNFYPRKDERHSGESVVPYELIEVWDARSVKSGVNPWERSMGFKAVESKTDVSGLLAIVALDPADKEFMSELASEGLKAAQNNPNRAHLVLNPYLYEYFPQPGNDLFPSRPER